MARIKLMPTVTGDCSTCGFWKRKGSCIKGKLVPGGTGKCTRPEGLCENPKPKDPHPGWSYPRKEKGASSQAPETTSPDSPKPDNETYLSQIYPNPNQPRKIFEQGALEELAQSIREQGLIEPLVVVRRSQEDDGGCPDPSPAAKRFMLIAGERRWRACQMAGLTKTPVRIIEATDDQVAEMALVENIQRQDLTPLEEAKAFQEMLTRGYTQETLAQKLGFKQIWRIDERLSLLNLSPKFQDALIYRVLSPSQAFEISRLPEPDDQEAVFQKIKAGQLPTYNHLRKFVNALVDAKKERFLFAVPKKEDLETINRWEKVLDAVTGLVVKSFSLDDCRVLARVLNGNSAVNVQKIELIIKHFNLLKAAMLKNASRQEAVALAEGGQCGK